MPLDACDIGFAVARNWLFLVPDATKVGECQIGVFFQWHAIQQSAGIVLAINVPVVVPFIEQTLGFQIMPGDVYYVTAIPSILEVEDVTIIAISAFILTSLATLYPAYRAARVQPRASSP